MKISIIVAMGENRVIGMNNQMPWHLPSDLKFFKSKTMGKPIIMGRKTFESIGKALPGRTNIVITRNKEWFVEGVVVVHTIEEALRTAQGQNEKEAMIIGGAQIYSAVLDRVDRLYITEVGLSPDGDTWFPAIDKSGWIETRREEHSGNNVSPSHAFITLDRKT